MNSEVIKANILNRINERCVEISKLIEEMRNVFDCGRYTNVMVNGVGYIANVEADCVSVQTWIADPERSIGGYWKTDMIHRPLVGWNWKCLADKIWDYKSTDAETLKDLKWRFDVEKAEMDAIRRVLEAKKAESAGALEFFGAN